VLTAGNIEALHSDIDLCFLLVKVRLKHTRQPHQIVQATQTFDMLDRKRCSLADATSQTAKRERSGPMALLTLTTAPHPTKYNTRVLASEYAKRKSRRNFTLSLADPCSDCECEQLAIMLC
jgi:hypothetical protein